MSEQQDFMYGQSVITRLGRGIVNECRGDFIEVRYNTSEGCIVKTHARNEVTILGNPDRGKRWRKR